MTLRCIACRRPLETPAATITRSGVTGHFGPKCAQKAGLFAALTKTVKRRGAQVCSPSRKPKKDDRQMPLELEVVE